MATTHDPSIHGPARTGRHWDLSFALAVLAVAAMLFYFLVYPRLGS